MVKGVPLIDWTGLESRDVFDVSILLRSMDVPVGKVVGDISAVCVSAIIYTLTLSPLVNCFKFSIAANIVLQAYTSSRQLFVSLPLFPATKSSSTGQCLRR